MRSVLILLSILALHNQNTFRFFATACLAIVLSGCVAPFPKNAEEANRQHQERMYPNNGYDQNQDAKKVSGFTEVRNPQDQNFDIGELVDKKETLYGFHIKAECSSSSTDEFYVARPLKNAEFQWNIDDKSGKAISDWDGDIQIGVSLKSLPTSIGLTYKSKHYNVQVMPQGMSVKIDENECKVGTDGKF